MVQGEKGKNLAPKKGPWSSELLDKWLATLEQNQGRFMAIELFDQRKLQAIIPMSL